MSMSSRVKPAKSRSICGNLRKMLAKPAQREIMADVHRSIGQSLSKLGVSGDIRVGYPSDWDDIPNCPFHVPGFDT